MNIRTFLSVAAIASALATPGMAFAQDQHMISGKAVPADQVAEVQAKCDDLRKAEPAQTTPAPSADAAQPAASATPAAGTAGWTEDGTKIDLTKLTVAMCDEAMFTASAM